VHGRPQEFFQGGAKILRCQNLTLFTKQNCLVLKKSSVFRMFLDFQVILLSIVSIDDSKNAIKLYPFIIKD